MEDIIELTPFKKLLKRAFDLMISITVLILTAPAFLLISITIKLNSKGPVFYKIQRFAPDGSRLFLRKFRTMYISDKDSMAMWAKQDDPRITKLGSFLRKTALDELPMFINVIKGDMSIVGPRTKHELEYERYKTIATSQLKIKSGITSPSRGLSYSFDNDDVMQKLYSDEVNYIKKWSLWADFKVLGNTVLRSFISSNAY